MISLKRNLNQVKILLSYSIIEATLESSFMKLKSSPERITEIILSMIEKRIILAHHEQTIWKSINGS